MITIPIGNTVLFLTEDEADDLGEELGTRCHAAELQGVIEIPDLLAVSVDDRESWFLHAYKRSPSKTDGLLGYRLKIIHDIKRVISYLDRFCRT